MSRYERRRVMVIGVLVLGALLGFSHGFHGERWHHGPHACRGSSHHDHGQCGHGDHDCCHTCEDW